MRDSLQNANLERIVALARHAFSRLSVIVSIAGIDLAPRGEHYEANQGYIAASLMPGPSVQGSRPHRVHGTEGTMGQMLQTLRHEHKLECLDTICVQQTKPGCLLETLDCMLQDLMHVLSVRARAVMSLTDSIAYSF